jgi:hypothetical protein
MYKYKLTLLQAVRFAGTNKDFILFNFDNNNKILDYKLTNDLNRWRKHYNTFRLSDIIKQQVNLNLKIE